MMCSKETNSDPESFHNMSSTTHHLHHYLNHQRAFFKKPSNSRQERDGEDIWNGSVLGWSVTHESILLPHDRKTWFRIDDTFTDFALCLMDWKRRLAALKRITMSFQWNSFLTMRESKWYANDIRVQYLLHAWGLFFMCPHSRGMTTRAVVAVTLFPWKWSVGTPSTTTARVISILFLPTFRYYILTCLRSCLLYCLVRQRISRPWQLRGKHFFIWHYKLTHRASFVSTPCHKFAFFSTRLLQGGILVRCYWTRHILNQHWFCREYISSNR